MKVITSYRFIASYIETVTKHLENHVDSDARAMIDSTTIIAMPRTDDDFITRVVLMISDTMPNIADNILARYFDYTMNFDYTMVTHGSGTITLFWFIDMEKNENGFFFPALKWIGILKNIFTMDIIDDNDEYLNFVDENDDIVKKIFLSVEREFLISGGINSAMTIA